MSPAPKLSSVRILPLSVAACLIAGIVYLWQFELKRDVEFQQRLISNRADTLRSEISKSLKQTTLAMQRFAKRVEYLGSQDKHYLAIDSRSYLDQLPLLRRIGISR